MAIEFIDHLVNERSKEDVLNTSLIEITKISANSNSSLFLIHRNMVGIPRCVGDYVDKIGCAQFVNFYFDGWGFCGE
jgi:hypothetical protein